MPETASPLADAARRYGDAPALVAGGRVWSFREYDAAVSAAVAGLRQEGLRPGDRLALWGPASARYVFLLMGCFRAGVVACPLSTRLPESAVVDHVRRAGCRMLAMSEDGTPPSGLRTVPLRRFFEAGAGSKGPALIDRRRPAVAVFTSGSAGSPKAALLAYGNLCANAEASNRNLAVAPGDRWLLSLPLYHVSGLGILFRCLLAGGTVVIPRPDASLEDSLVAQRITHASLVSTQLHRLLAGPEGERAREGLKAILLGGSGFPEPLLERALERRLPIRTSYGMTETASQIATSNIHDSTAADLRAVRPLVPGSVRISPEGEITVQGPTVFLGYLDGDRIARPFTSAGEFRTGDLGRLTADGRLTVTGRRDNMFISGGENVQPEEIERELCRLDEVEQALVVPVEDAEFGCRPVAFVKTRPEIPFASAAFANALGERLPRFKVPAAFLPWPDALERPGTKLSRKEFAAAAREALGLSRP